MSANFVVYGFAIATLLLAGGTPASASETLALPGNYRQSRRA